MKVFRQTILAGALVGCTLLSCAGQSLACGSASKESADPKLLLAGADVIVRVVAVTYKGETLFSPRDEYFAPLIEFRVLEVLKGDDVPAALHFIGQLNTKDDFNPPGMPLHAIRPSGTSGSCHAYSYKKDAEFLLFLKRRDAGLTPYWAAMAPANQQLRASDDPWLLWVKNNLASPKNKQ